MFKFKFDIITLCETWLNDTISDNEIGLDGYDLIRKDRNRSGGGVVMYIRNMISYKVRSDIMPDTLETITIEVAKYRAKPFFINTWYRAPNTPSEVFDKYESGIKKLDSEDKEIICIGDLNCNWPEPKKTETQNLLQLTKLFQLEQMIEEPTRITETARTLIDLIFTNRGRSYK